MTDLFEVDGANRKEAHTHPDRVLAAIGRRQRGVVTHEQLIAAGLGPSAIHRRVTCGRLHRLHRGVYAVGHRALTKHARWHAAVLACGPEALLSHRCAGAVWELLAHTAIVAEIVVPARGRRPRPGIRLHHARSLRAEDRAVRDGIPVTNVARTMLDLAAVLSLRELERAVEEAERLGRLSVRAVLRLLERSHGHPGSGRLARLLAVDRAGVALTRSALEARFLAVCRDHGLPRPLVNARLAGYEVDAVWPAARLVVELDGFAFHRTRQAFERDRAKDAALQRARYRVVRFTYRMLAGGPAAVAATVWSLLQGPGASLLV